MQGETARYYHRIFLVRPHEVQVSGIVGFIVEGVSQQKFDVEWVYYYIAQTNLDYEVFAGECVQRCADYKLNQQGIRYDDLPLFLPIPNEIREFIKQSLSKSRRKHYILRMMNLRKRR